MAAHRPGTNLIGPIAPAPACLVTGAPRLGTNPTDRTNRVWDDHLTADRQHGINQTGPISPALVGHLAGVRLIGGHQTGDHRFSDHLIIGLGILYVVLLFAQPVIDQAYGLWLPVNAPGLREFWVLVAVIAASAIVSLVPALRAYRLSLVDGMMVRS